MVDKNFFVNERPKTRKDIPNYYDYISPAVDTSSEEKVIDPLEFLKLSSQYNDIFLRANAAAEQGTESTEESQSDSDSSVISELANSDTDSVLKKNFHKELCSACTTLDTKYKSKYKVPKNENILNSLKIMFNFYGVLKKHGFRLACLDSKSSFLPSESEENDSAGSSCSITNISSAKMYSKLFEVLVEKLGFKQIQNGSSLWAHKHYGYALVHNTKVLVLSKVYEDFFSKIYQYIHSQIHLDVMEFMDFSINTFHYDLKVTGNKYIKKICKELFNKDALDYISKGAKSPFEESMGVLLSLPRYVSDVVSPVKALEFFEDQGIISYPTGFVHDKSFNKEKLQRALHLIRDIMYFLPDDYNYYCAVLQNFKEIPEKPVYFTLVHLFAHLTTQDVGRSYNVVPVGGPCQVEMVIQSMEDDVDKDVVYINPGVGFASNHWMSFSERQNLSSMSKLAHLICFTEIVMEKLFSYQKYIDSLTLIGYKQKPTYSVVIFDTDLFFALFDRQIIEDVPKSVQTSFKRIVKLMDLHHVQVLNGPNHVNCDCCK